MSDRLSTEVGSRRDQAIKDFAHELFERLTEYSLVAGREMVAQGIDVLWLGDDFGTQRTMLISPKMWREFIKSRYARLITAFKAQNPNLKIAYHCDGYFEPIIPELIEIGLDVLNPVQPLSMDPAEIKRIRELIIDMDGVDIKDDATTWPSFLD